MNIFRSLLLTSCMLSINSGALAQDDLPSREEMWKIIQQQQKQIDALMTQQKSSVAKIEETVSMVEATADAVDQKQATSVSKTHIGGYAELHYNNLEDQTSGVKKNEIDFHRFVLFFGHEFNEKTRFFSELELEHSIAGDGKNGEIELEQAYIEHDMTASLSGKAGLFLLPVGILNETHEPNTFYGVERNQVEKNIIPTTWWAGGLGLTGRFGSGWSYDAAATSGLNTSAADDYKPRNGRQKVSKAVANNGALTGRLKWTGLPGLELTASLQYQDDITQGNDPLAGAATLAETHIVLQRGAFGLRALYAQWNLDGEGPASIGADKQLGWYIEPAWRINQAIGLFARYEQWDNTAGAHFDSQYAQSSIGANYWLNEHVVFKFDLQDQDAPEGAKELDGFNLGVGYQF
ncbi:MAG: porin [Pseudomonadota bacterium]|nr:porin [Pseudomonadota bacterium]